MPQFFKSVLSSMIGTVLAFGLMFFLSMLILTSTVAFFSQPKLTAVKGHSALLIELAGELVEKEDPLYLNLREQIFFGGRARTHGLFDIQESLRIAAEDERIKVVLIHLDGLRSGLSKITALKRSLDQFRESGKKVIGYANSLNMAETYLATSFDTLFFSPFVSADIKGVGFVPVFFKGTLDKIGVKTLTFRAGEYKSAVETFTRTNLSPKARENLEEIGADLWQVLAEAHSQRWGLSLEEINKRASELYFEFPGVLSNFEGARFGTSLPELKPVLGRVAELGTEEPYNYIKYQRYLFSSMQGGALSLSADTIAIVLAEGEIVDRGSSAGSFIVGNEWAEEFQKVCENKNVKAVVIRINSPGGSAQASDIMNQSVEICDGLKPVVASFSDIAASGGYYMAANAQKVFAEPTTITGSIGVFGLVFQSQEFLENKLGLAFDAVKTHPYADQGNPGRPLSPGEAQRIEQQIDWVYDQFLGVVVRGRGFESKEALLPLAGGKIWSGTRAKSVGLVDELGGLQEAISWAANAAGLADFTVEFFPKPGSPIEVLMREFGMEALTKLPFWKTYSLVDEVRQKGQLHQIYTRVPWDFHGLMTY